MTKEFSVARSFVPMTPLSPIERARVIEEAKSSPPLHWFSANPGAEVGQVGRERKRNSPL